MSTLVLADSPRGAWPEALLRWALEGGDTVLMGIGVSAESLLSECTQLSGVSGLRTDDFYEDSREAAEDVRTWIPRLMRSAHRSLREPLTYQGRVLWRYLELSEKNIWLGNETIVHRLYALGRVDRAMARLKPKTLLVALEDRSLSKVLIEGLARQSPGLRVVDLSGPPQPAPSQTRFFFRFLKAALRESLSALTKGFWARSLRDGFGIGDAPLGASAFFSLYPYFWAEPLSGEKAKERFFQSLPDTLGTQEPNYFLAWMTSRREVASSINQAQAMLKRKKVLLLQAFLRFGDYFKILDVGLAARAARLLETYRREFRFNYRGYGLEPLLEQDIVGSFLGASFFSALLCERALARVGAVLQPKRVIYRLEFQPFEFALLNAFKDRAFTVGFQHSAASKNFLSYVFEPNEFLEDGTLLPDRILTTGEVGRDILVEDGYPAERIRPVGPVRYRSIPIFLSTRKPTAEIRAEFRVADRDLVLYVAASPLYGETTSMLTSLFAALKDIGGRPYVVFKTHPSEPRLAELQALFAKSLSSDQYLFLSHLTPFYEILSACDGILLTGSTVGAEAIALGVVPVIFECSAQFGNNSLADHRESALHAHDRESLASVLRELRNHGPTLQQKQAHWPKTLQQIFLGFDHDPNERFVAELMRPPESPRTGTS